jgi:signal peptidase I
MMPFLTANHVKEAKIIAKNARKILDYKRDLLDETTAAEFEARIIALERASASRDEATVKLESDRLEKLWVKSLPPPPADAGWRENCEVFLVAIVIAIAVRTYFLQPFTIPTGSMQPTLNGIIGVPTDDPPPNFFKRVWDFAVLGRGYINVVATEDGSVTNLTEKNPLPFLTYCVLECGDKKYIIYAPEATLEHDFKIGRWTAYRTGDVIARGYVTAGDHVFVDKMSYNFRRPDRGRVFVFKTTGITGIERTLPPGSGSQFFIKRLAGLPGDTLRIDSPLLYVNGALAKGIGFERVMTMREPGYRGYEERGLLSDGESFTLPPKTYFALGDNSYNSLDSRYWGTVPEKNIMGHGLIVYWPFNSHWGLIR